MGQFAPLRAVPDLHSGPAIWDRPPPPLSRRPAPVQTDVAIVGAGMTGAFIAERLTREGHDVVVIDREAPLHGSTAASTALLLWELDKPLMELETRLGFAHAANVYRYSHETLLGIRHLVKELDIQCDAEWLPAVYLAGSRLDTKALREEHRARGFAALPGALVEADRLRDAYGLNREAGILSPDAGQLDPVALASGLLRAAMKRGARLISPAHVVHYDCAARGVTLETADGTDIDARLVVLASGYDMPDFVPAHRQRMVSTWALATQPQQRRGVHPPTWEASDPYLYLRGTVDGRLVVGGADEPVTDARQREALTEGKVKALRAALHELMPDADTTVAEAWSGLFGETDDGMPLIGRVPGKPNCVAAFGYGGNGLTFSAMAADMIATIARGQCHWAEDLFAVDR